MGTSRYVALLRGINVGGRNVLPMADLRAALIAAGYESVSTYIQSGNVLFTSEAPSASLERDLEQTIERELGVSVPVVLRSLRQLRNVVEKAPAGFGEEPDTFHSDVVFLKAPMSSNQAIRIVDPREGVDQAWPGTGVLYFARKSDRLSQSRLSRITGAREYKQMTIRTWSTTKKLLELLDERAARPGAR